MSMERNSPKPPKLFEAFLNWYCADSFLEDLKGDLYEYHGRRFKNRGKFYANFMFMIDVLRNIKPHLFKRENGNRANMMDVFLSNLISIRRNLKRNRAFAAINITGLALGMSGALFIWHYVDHELSYEDFHENRSQIYRLTSEYIADTGFEVHWARTPMDWVDQLIAEIPEIKRQIRFQNYYPRIVKVGEKSFKEEHGFSVDSSVFEMFSFELLSGDSESALQYPYSVVLSSSISKKYFGEQDAMGKIVQIVNEGDSSLENYKVTGVIKDLPSNTHLPINFLTSFRSPDERKGWAYNYVQLENGTDISSVRSKIRGLIDKYQEEENRGESFLHLQPIEDIHLHSHLAREIKPNGDIFYVKIFGSAGIFILLMAMINFTNLSTSKAFDRTKEVGVRKVLGSSRKGLIGYFVTESMLYSLVASVLALIVITLLAPVFHQISGILIQLDWELLAVILLLAIVVGLVSGIYPAIAISGFKPIAALKGLSTTNFNPRKVSVRTMLIATQFVMALIVLSSTMITNRQFDYLQNKNLGFSTDQVLGILNSPTDAQDEYEKLRHEIKQIPGVVAVTANMEVPSREIRDTGTISFEDIEEENTGIIMDLQVADSNYIEFMDMDLLAGKNFDKDYHNLPFPPKGSPVDAYYEYANSSRREYIINETALRLLSLEDPGAAIGKRFKWGNGILNFQEGPIVGVVRDSHQETLKNKVDPVVFVYEPLFLRTFLVKLETGNIQASLSGIEDVWKGMFPDFPMESAFLDDLFAKLYQSEQRQKETLSIFSILIVIIALMGLLGLLSFMIQKRMKELAIRKILGASRLSIVALFARSFVVQALVALVISAPVTSYYMSEWLENFAYRISISGIEFFTSFIVLLIVLSITISIQVGRSANLNPVDTLRYE